MSKHTIPTSFKLALLLLVAIVLLPASGALVVAQDVADASQPVQATFDQADAARLVEEARQEKLDSLDLRDNSSASPRALAEEVNPAAIGQSDARYLEGNLDREALAEELRANFAPDIAEVAAEAIVTREGNLSVIVVLDGPPVARTNPNVRSTAGLAAAQSLEATQAGIARQVSGLGGNVIGSTQYVLNSLMVEIPRGQLNALAGLAGVQAVYPDVYGQLDLEESVPFIGADSFWNNTGVTGSGMTVAIIDSGIDYFHPTFGDCSGGIGTGTCKIIGGFDFADDTNDLNPSTGISPDTGEDPDPFDECDGHGTHVASTAAGFGTLDDGSTNGASFFGPYDGNTYLNNDFFVGPGVAPEADLLVYRMLGCAGNPYGVAVSDTIRSIDQAVIDGADVMNMSLGFLNMQPAGPFNQAIDNALVAGTMVVSSQGNDNDTHSGGGLPGMNVNSIAVAAFYDAGEGTPQVVVNSPFSATYTAGSAGFGPSLLSVGPITGNVILAVDATAGGTINDGCEAFTNAGDFGGPNDIALIERGACSFVQKTVNAQAAGAEAVIIWNLAGDAIGLGGADPSIVIPAVSVGTPDGQAIATELGNGPVNVTLEAIPSSDTIAPFSTRGPSRNAGLTSKPDLGGPGVNVFAAYVDGAGNPISANLSGTSMSAPHVAGFMALLKQRYPTWELRELKALAMNTGVDVFEEPLQQGLRYGPIRAGGGRISFDNIYALDNADALTLAYNATNPSEVSVSFGAIEIVEGSTTSLSQTITVENVSGTSHDYSVPQIPDVHSAPPGVTFTVTPNTFTLAPGATQTLTLTINVDATATSGFNTIDPTMSLQMTTGYGLDWPRDFQSEAMGWVDIDITSAAVPGIRVPFYAITKLVADVELDTFFPPVFGPTSVSSSEAYLFGNGLFTGTNFPFDVLSTVIPFVYIGTDADDPQFYADTPDDFADIQHVGVTEDLFATNSDNRIYFAISTYEDWDTPIGQVFFVNIDCDFDGVIDTRFGNTPNGYFLGGEAGNFHWLWYETDPVNDPGSYTTIPIEINEGEVLGTLPMYEFNNNVMVLPWSLNFSDYGSSHPCGNFSPLFGFEFFIESFLPADGYEVAVDTTDTFLYIPALSPYSFSSSFDFDGVDYSNIPAWVADPEGSSFTFPIDGFLGGFNPGDDLPDIMAVFHHNGVGNRVQLLDPILTDEGDLDMFATGPQYFNNGKEYTFTMSSLNWGPTEAQGVVLEAVLPQYVDFVSSTCDNIVPEPFIFAVQGFAGNIVGTENVVSNADGTTTYTCTLPDRSFPTWYRVQVDLTVLANGGDIGDAAVMNFTTTSFADEVAFPQDNFDNIAICFGDTQTCSEEYLAQLEAEQAAAAAAANAAGATQAGAADQMITMGAGAPGFVGRGDTFNMPIVITNTTGATMNDVVVRIVFPAGINITGATTTDGSASVVSEVVSRDIENNVMGQPRDLEQTGATRNVVVVTHSSMAAGAAMTINITGQVTDAFTGAFITMDVSVTASGALMSSRQLILPLVSQLPATGEEPMWREYLMLLALLGLVTVGSAGAFVAYRRRQEA